MRGIFSDYQLSLGSQPTELDAMDRRLQSEGSVPAGLPAAAVASMALLPPARLHARARRLFYLLLGAWIINLFDLGLTLVAEQQNLLVEMNPFAARVLPHGPVAVIVYKFVMLTIGTAALWYCRSHWATEPAVWVYVGLCVGLSFWWRHVLKEAEPVWMMANTADKILPNGAQFIPGPTLRPEPVWPNEG